MFRVSTKVDYGIIVLRTLAKTRGSSATSLRTIAQQTRLPYPYLARVMAALAKAGIVISREGVRGGYALGKRPSAVTLNDVIKALEPKQRVTRCAPSDHATCKLRRSCPMAPWWLEFSADLEKKMQTTTLEALL